MGFLKKFFRFIAEYFVFFVGFLFIFVIGLFYAFIRPQGLVFNLIFLVIAIGWVIFLIRYFWEIMEKQKSSDNNKD
ncbi:hypothetical protein A2714_01300 [Candidatus Woesebacteria bacterium RIFCSPHIGHO2_01_FULL_38_9]|uniref:Uncharacterized protein n=2 Tax=Candidatus Woeseibacteriota TaxID=1752722 RepID=A0A1F7XZG1_9BACT|nr:MAG: hypothetical protein A2714_01300 [Candidatus Woesebacteria bacterium RIFCSPHIGHO2_01_FULL_38_9]OGM58826.1 MAG: hypothetical protein A3A75_06185 [Candidatus Woesebacteria bacterium RIFCSPLOWO2_01_FULL_39_10]